MNIVSNHFTGQQSVNIDQQGRIVIPFRWKERLMEKSPLFLSKAMGEEANHLVLYPYTEWNKLVSQVSNFRNLKSEPFAERRLKRYLFGSTHELEIDGNNRALIPADLLKHAQIDKKVFMNAADEVIEMWNEELYHETIDAETANQIINKGITENIRIY